ncbi:uncharacterized protein METZ01_LOCUS198926 [marine metagenome]|uniref:Uncharacterized protein n=1 Tax=marine metagenome TaxID=408172 RepID=A0A382E6V6_9ZZZZ
MSLFLGKYANPVRLLLEHSKGLAEKFRVDKA